MPQPFSLPRYSKNRTAALQLKETHPCPERGIVFVSKAGQYQPIATWHATLTPLGLAEGDKMRTHRQVPTSGQRDYRRRTAMSTLSLPEDAISRVLTAVQFGMSPKEL